MTFSEKQGKAKLGSHALELMVYNTVYEDCGYIGSKKSHIILNDNLSNSLDMKGNNIYNPADPVN